MDYFKRKKIIFWFIVGLLTVNFVSLGTLWFFHFQKENLPRWREHRRHIRLEQRLGLTEKQVQQFMDARREQWRQSQPIHYRIRSLKKELMATVFMENPDPEKIKFLSQQIGEQVMAFELLSQQHFRKLKSICTKEQVPGLERILLRMVDFMGPHKGKRHRGRRMDDSPFPPEPPVPFQEQE